jgi:hypothetical protein
MRLYFDKENFNNNKSFEKYITKFGIYIYLFITNALLLTLKLNNIDFEILDDILNTISQYCGIDLSQNKTIETYHNHVK